MKITKQAIPPQDRKWIGKCKNCGAEAEAIQSELTNPKFARVYWSKSTGYAQETCPICKKENGMKFEYFE